MTSLRSLAAVLFLIVAVGCATLLWVHHSASPNEVIEATVYRSAQPSPEMLRDAKDDFGIETIINLRGSNPGTDWFEAETRTAREEDLHLANLPFETYDAPPRIETLALVRALDATDAPILIHCRSGNDRSGWAAGVVRLLHGEPLGAARAELSFLAGHFCRRGECALHAFFDDYESWLERNDREHDAAAFREWIARDYYPEPYHARLTMERFPSTRIQSGEKVTMTVRIENGARTGWTARSDTSRGIRPGARLLGPFDELPADILARFRLAHAPAKDVWREHWEGRWPPGESRDLRVVFGAPEVPGLWVAQIDMVDEGVHWFSDLGDPGLLVPFRVVTKTAD